MRLPKSLAARFGAVAATAAIAITGATSAANAATAAPAAPATATHYVHRIPTKLAISNTLPKGHFPHRTVLINGHLTAGKYNLRHLRVFLVRRGYKGHWYVVQTQLTEKFGHVLFRVHLGKKATCFRLAFLGTKNFAPSVSKAKTLS
jgi:hypothetical protein